MIELVRTTSENQDFIDLVKLLDADLKERDGEDHAFYNQFNKIDNLRLVIVAYKGNNPIGCGAMKEFQPDTLEIKRMYVPPKHRGEGIATKILAELEKWASELSYLKCVLETGKRQPEAVRLYQKNGYKRIPNYGQYADIENSLCFEKEIIS